MKDPQNARKAIPGERRQCDRGFCAVQSPARFRFADPHTSRVFLDGDGAALFGEQDYAVVRGNDYILFDLPLMDDLAINKYDGGIFGAFCLKYSKT